MAMLACAAATAASAQPPAAAGSDAAAIEAVLQASARDWSRGDLAAFMRCYENAPGTSFITSQGPIQGYDRIAARYAQHYGSGQAMGRLSLTVLDDRPLSPAYALVTGRFALSRVAQDGGDAHGIFTLLFHRTSSGWRIAYDHTS